MERAFVNYVDSVIGGFELTDIVVYRNMVILHSDEKEIKILYSPSGNNIRIYFISLEANFEFVEYIVDLVKDMFDIEFEIAVNTRIKNNENKELWRIALKEYEKIVEEYS